MAEPVDAHCPTCDGNRSCDVHGTVYKPWHWENRQGDTVDGGVHHSLLECRGCHTIFYEKSSWNSEDIDYWYDDEGNSQGEERKTKETHPQPNIKNKPAWIGKLYKVDEQLFAILGEMYTAYYIKSYILTAIGLRTALDRATEVLGIDPAKTFKEKLIALKDGGWIGDTEKDILGVVTDAGNAAAHKGWSPDANDVELLLSAMEIFLQKAFVNGKKALDIKASIPEKPSRTTS
jgi:hypothetical protein